MQLKRFLKKNVELFLGVGEVVGGFRNVIPIVGGTFEVTGEKYSWLRNSMFIGTLDLHPKGVHLHFYQLV